ICFLDENYFVSMTNDISTTNHIGVEISFWWLCAGSINNFGEVYYSIDGGNSWVLLSNTGYQNQTSWMKTTIANPIFDNQSQLRFGFRFVNGITTTAADPAFSIDEIQIASTCANTSSNIIVSQCGPYTVPSGNTTHNASGFYTDTIPNSMGCDSIILIDLTINNNTSSSTNVSSCYTYTVPSGDETYTSDGMYLDTIPNTAGCDSIITINLTIKTVDTSLTLAGNLITANATGATYQWVDCLNAYSLIPGETNQSYTITVNGIYAVVITQNGCQDTSGCIRLDNVGLEENSLFNITTYPNPSDGYVYLNIPEHLPFLKIDLLNSYGAVIEKGKFLTNKSKFINLNSQSSGVYFIKIYNDLYSKTFKVILE
ncbi:MAG: T9SS type A sorting domain-containing protein, partial [Bacteroidia bacterium]|nr:T9SS type A sorting domain-containing protein [Bacteroidia bacterium]